MTHHICIALFFVVSVVSGETLTAFRFPVRHNLNATLVIDTKPSPTGYDQVMAASSLISVKVAG